jgi:hypothetical protein
VDISRETAVKACDQVRAHNARRYWSPAHWQCWGCIRFGGEPEKRCMRSENGWDACPQVNWWVEHSMSARSRSKQALTGDPPDRSATR